MDRLQHEKNQSLLIQKSSGKEVKILKKPNKILKTET